MQAVVCHAAQDLRVENVSTPTLAPDEVLAKVAFGGICGSDMHYFRNGAVGDFALREPLVLGHEVSGWVEAMGEAVTGLEKGMKAALNPSRACRQCRYCKSGRSNLCTDMRFLGSAGRYPHVQGGFSQYLVLRADQIIPVPDDTDLLKLSVAEPLSVALHAVNRAGALMGKRVIVTGSGPIGLLTALAAKQAGASYVVSTDIEDAALSVAKDKVGVDATVNVRTEPGGLAEYAEDDARFDVALEASGSAQALCSLFDVVRRGGRIVQLGMLPPGLTEIPVGRLQTGEIDMVGAFRAHDEFEAAVEAIVSARIDVTPILSGTYPVDDAQSAFLNAGDRNKVVKLHLELNPA